MQQAVNIMYGGNYPITATHLYVRFKPANIAQLMTLAETEDLELQDHPMDYEVVQDGDYYQDPLLGTDDFPWLYTVVPIGYAFPSGIQHQILEQLYLPENNEYLEDLAESMAQGAQYHSYRTGEEDRVVIQRTDIDVAHFEFESDPCYCNPMTDCVPNPLCEETGGGPGGGGNDPRVPRGTIQVQDVRACGNSTTNVPVRQARIVCKRWFKIDRTYTNDQGGFVSSKRFKSRVKVNLKTQNQYAVVKKVRGIRLWQMLFPVKKRIGVFDQGNLANISFVFTRPSPTAANDPQLSYWVAATTHNSVLEYRQYATEFGVGQPPAGLKIIVSNWGFMRASGAAPLWSQCSNLSSELGTSSTLISSFVMDTVLALVGAAVMAAVETLKDETDILLGYAALLGNYHCRLTSADIKALAYGGLAQASHYMQAGCDYWRNYRTRVADNLLQSGFGDPFGDGTRPNAGLVAVSEMWRNYIAHLFTDRHYGNGGANGPFGVGFTARLQNRDWENVPGLLNAYLWAIENFDPNDGGDPHRWIPRGLLYDLTDYRNDGNNPVFDDVISYTTAQFFGALQDDVRTVPAFRDRLLQQNANLQQPQVNQLFQQYGY